MKYAALKMAECAIFPDPASEICNVKAERDAHKVLIDASADTGRAHWDGAGLVQCLLNCD